jgi:ATP-dependent phosphofructokinase / diphosphate-dependent phosphofructokinase
VASKGTIGILTGGGDVPGLNPAIRAITIRALREGYRVLGIRRGWAGLVDLVPDPKADNRDNVQELSEEIVNRAGRTGGTFLHTSRTRPSHLPKPMVPEHLRDRYTSRDQRRHRRASSRTSGSWASTSSSPSAAMTR